MLLASTVRDNMALPSVGALSHFGVRAFAREAALAKDMVERLSVRCNDIDQIASSLSGGNQQKVVIGKWLATEPRVLLLDEPTRGIDVGAKQEIYQLVFALASRGLGIVVVSSEMPELLLLSDRVLVMCEGRQTGVLSRAEATQEKIMRLAAPGLGERAAGAPHEPASRAPSHSLPHQALLGAGPHLPDRRGSFAGNVLGREHLPLLPESDRRAAAGVDHRPRGDRNDHRHPARRHRSVGRLGHGLFVGHLCDASDPAGMDARRDHGRARRDDFDRRSRSAFWRGSCSMASSADATSKRGGGGRSCWGRGAAIAFPWFSVSRPVSRSPPSPPRRFDAKFGVLAVLLVTPCFALALGAINGVLIVEGGLQPFIATLAMMVSALGIGRLTGGQDFAVIPVYTGTNATEAFDVLRSMVWGLIPMPSIFFLVAIVLFGAILRFTTFGRYVYAIGGNVEAAKLSGVKVKQVQFAAYVISGMLAGLAGVLFVAQYRQGKPDAGSGLELDAIAAVVIGGTSLMGGRGGLAGTFVGVLIFGLLSDILQLQNIDSNVQLLMKGLIIVGTVFVQEQNLGQLLLQWRGGPLALAPTRAGSVETARPPDAAKASIVREDIHEKT